jgi:predicted DNA-binding transcriptional regulator AlpA
VAAQGRRFVTIQEAMARMGYRSHVSIYAMIQRGKLPKLYRVGANRVGFDDAEFEAALAAFALNEGTEARGVRGRKSAGAVSVLRDRREVAS